MPGNCGSLGDGDAGIERQRGSDAEATPGKGAGTMTYEDLKPLLSWRTSCSVGLWSASMLANALSCEGMERVQLPAKFESTLVGFRRRRHVERVKLCKRFLDERAVGLHMKPRDTLRQQIEDFLPPDCAACGWSQPGPHAKGCKLEPILEQISKHERIVAKLVQEVGRL